MSMTPDECYAILGVDPSATKADVKRAFRRLVKEYHPDRSSDPHAAAYFPRIVRAYRMLQRAFRNEETGEAIAECPRCRRAAELFEGLDGRRLCLDCLIGKSRHRFFLPLPVMRIVRHTSVLALQALGVYLFVRAFSSGNLTYGAASLAAFAVAFVILAVTCLIVRDVE